MVNNINFKSKRQQTLNTLKLHFIYHLKSNKAIITQTTKDNLHHWLHVVVNIADVEALTL